MTHTTMMRDSLLRHIMERPSVSNVEEKLFRHAIRVRDQGKYREAIETYQRVLDNQKNSCHGIFQVEHARLLYLMADLFVELGQNDTALKLFQDSLLMWHEALGANNIYVAMTLNGIGETLVAKGNNDAGLAVIKQSLDTTKQWLEGSTQIDIYFVGALHSIGIAHYHMGNLETSLECFEDALETKKRWLGDLHVELLPTSNNVGEVFLSLGEYDKARFVFKKVLKSGKKLQLPNHHPYVSAALFGIGKVHFRNDYMSQAMVYFLLSLKSIKGGDGRDDQPLRLAQVHIFIASIYERRGNLLKAKRKLKKALRLQRLLLEDDNVSVMTTMLNLGNVRLKRGSSEEARRLFKTLLDPGVIS
mmetsp:Transcript_20998/g.37923  ORF Transcript_20998/g.37923 Transcript_20998/m.37923 type:complete len:360 (-) Transcript_20998:155-1234(-)